KTRGIFFVHGLNYFFNESLISINNFSCKLGSGSTSGAGAGAFLILLTNLITINNENATMVNEITSERNLPYLIAVPGIARSARLVKLAAFNAGVNIAGVIISLTNELTIPPNAPPMITP